MQKRVPTVNYAKMQCAMLMLKRVQTLSLERRTFHTPIERHIGDVAAGAAGNVGWGMLSLSKISAAKCVQINCLFVCVCVCVTAQHIPVVCHTSQPGHKPS